MAEVLCRAGTDGTWLATTDADSVVPRHWLTAQMSHAAASARVVVGTVTVTDWQERTDAVRDRAIEDYTATAIVTCTARTCRSLQRHITAPPALRRSPSMRM
jgi:hypothetical protein